MICTICSRHGHGAYACPWRVKAFFTVAAFAAALTGCSQSAPVEKPSVNIVGDTYCTAAKPHTWSRNDTTETIDQTRQHNAGYFARCRGKRG